MNAPRSDSSPAYSIFITVFLIVIITSTAITYILPESYASTARIKVEQNFNSGTNGTAYDPYFIQTEFEVIQSQLVLDPVITRLNLNVQWGKKYFNGETLKSTEAREILKGRMSLAPVRNTKLIAITIFSDDRNEAAQIANAIAESYRDYRLATAVHADPKIPADAPVVVVDKAEPGREPVRPNKPLNIALGVMAGIVLGALVSGVVALLRRGQ